MGFISQKLRDSARGQDCTFQIPGICIGGTETTVLCHLPSEVKGAGNKSDDINAAFGCHACHEAIDQHRLSREKELFFSMRAMQRTQRIWVQRGLLVVSGIALPKSSPSSKHQHGRSELARRFPVEDHQP